MWDLPRPGIKPVSLHCQVDSLPLSHQGDPLFSILDAYDLCVHTVVSVVSDSVQPYGLQPARLLCPWESPDKNTGVGCHALLQGNLPEPGIETASLMSPAWQVGSLPLVPLGKPHMTYVS